MSRPARWPRGWSPCGAAWPGRRRAPTPSRIAHRRPGRSRARSRHRRQPPGRPVPALSPRAVPGGAVPGQPRARSRGSGGALVRGSAPAPDRGFRPDHPRHDHAGVSSNRGTDAGGAGLAGQADPGRRADRGRGGLPDDTEGLRCDRRASRREFLLAAGGVAAGLGLGAIIAVDARARDPRGRCRRPSARWSARPRQHGQGQARAAAAVENGNAVPLTVSVESPMTEADHVQGDSRLHREEPAARRRRASASGRAPAGRAWRPASGSPTTQTRRRDRAS